MHLKIKKKRCKHSLLRVDNKTIKYQEKCPKDAEKKGYCIEHHHLHKGYKMKEKRDKRNDNKTNLSDLR